jgi:ribosomal protein S18 acetylase RimI-like enzyme
LLGLRFEKEASQTRDLRFPVCITIADVQLRPADPNDAMAVARIHVRSWQAAYRKLMPDEYLDQLRPEDRAKKYDFGSPDPLKPYTIVLTESGVIRGFATTAPTRDSSMPGYGELYALYVDPDCWGRGIGVALVTAARARLFDLGFRNAILWVLAGNVRAERFYRRDQWTPDGAQRTEEIWGITVNDVRYRRSLEAPERGF